MLVLLINPQIERVQISNEKPTLSVLVDNSLSIKHFQKETVVKSMLVELQSQQTLLNKFDIEHYQFDTSLQKLDSLNFSGNNTNIFNALEEITTIVSEKKSPVILITDGNQTQGSLYSYNTTKNRVYPVIIGDTIAPEDLRISQLNVNKYSYLKNKFPVEISLLYEGNKAVSSQLIIENKGKVVFREKVVLNPTKNVAVINAVLQSDKEGLHYYKASILPLEKEKNTENNAKTFSVEVLNEQTKILLLTSVVHPDLGALKKSIETNKQRSVTIQNISDFNSDLSDYQLVILYQPTVQFQSVFDRIKNSKQNYFVISGANTNWNFLNEMQPNYYKNSIQQTEDYTPTFNSGFLTFGQKNISFETFPPLTDAYGKITLNTKYDALLYQNIAGISTQTPLLATFENDTQKSAVLFGEGLWKWRAASFLHSNAFQDFDAFISNLIQYVASTKKRERLSVDYEQLYTANASIVFSAFYVDKNYQFDERAVITLKLTNTDTSISQNIPFSLKKNSFEGVLEDLPSGNYRFVVTVENQSIQKTGQFKITDYQIEEQFTKANYKDLKLLATKTDGNVYNETNISALYQDLINDTRYTSIQKSKRINEYLIDWELILLLVLLLFSVEWFIRKYYGKI